MLEIRITCELNDYAPKIAGPFTGRQCLCIVLGAAPCYLMYTILKDYIPIDILGFFCIIPAAIAVAFGWFKPYGMKMENYLRTVFITFVLSPTTRRYKSENRIRTMLNQIEAAELVAQETEAEGRKKNRKKNEKKPKYKRSPLAYR